MPTAPAGICRDCRRRAVEGTRYCPDHKTNNSAKQHKQAYDRYRSANDPIRALYRTQRWQALRRRVISRDILCRSCGYKAGTEVDHILPARLLIDHFGEEAFWDIERLQLLCHTCHSRKTTHESNWASKKGTQLNSLGDRSNTTVVCGRAGSGKTTYVEQHKAANDPVWDYDVVMAELTGLPMHQSLPGAIGSVLADRDRWIQATEYSTKHCWLIVANPKAGIVGAMRDAGAEVIVLNTDDDVCNERLRERFKTQQRLSTYE